eukprot:SAG25_NODE_6064_length_592_cov_1.188641_2_plen_95_part_00
MAGTHGSLSALRAGHEVLDQLLHLRRAQGAGSCAAALLRRGAGGCNGSVRGHELRWGAHAGVVKLHGRKTAGTHTTEFCTTSQRNGGGRKEDMV